MSADFISPRHSVTFLPTYLSIAIGVTLSCFAFSAQAATSKTYNELSVSDVLVEQDNKAPKVIYNRLKTPSTPVISQKTASEELVAKQTQLFFDCTQVQTDGARLACFDKVANQGETNLATKQSLDLVKTLKTTISGSPQVVLTVDTDLDNEQNTDRLLANQDADNEPLSTVGLTKNEAKVLEDAGVTQTDLEKYTPLSLAYDLDKNSERGTWTIRPHNPNYVLPLFYTAKPNLSPNSPSLDGGEFTSNDIRNTELKFQLSLKSKVAEDLFGTNADLWFGYTQDSHWQVYNEDNSRPFRATDYQPEIFLTQPVTANLPFGGRLRMLGAGGDASLKR